MKLRSVTTLTILGTCALIAVWLGQTPTASGHPGPAVTFVEEPLAGALAEDKYEFEGAKKCKMCHLKTFKSWEKTPHAKALETLMPGKAVDAKKKHGLDPEKDYTQDKTCLECHVTGFGKKGGYAIPKPDDKKAVKKAKELAGVGCEACHGAGSEFLKTFKEIQRSKRKYKQEELYKVGLTKMSVDQCKTCHNEKSPTFDKDAKFDYEAMRKKGVHDMEELKQRE